MWLDLLAIVGLGVLCGAWAALQRAGGSRDGARGRCGACSCAGGECERQRTAR